MKLSLEAMILSQEQAKRLDEIRAKVRNDFYFRSEVKEKVIEGLLRDFKSLMAR